METSFPATRLSDALLAKTLSQPFKTFVAPLHNVSKFPLTQRKPTPKKKCLPHSYCIAEACDLSRARRPAALSGKDQTERGLVVVCRWNEKGTFNFCKMSVGGSIQVCLLQVPGYWWFVREDHEASHLSVKNILSPPSVANHHQGLSSVTVSHSKVCFTGDKQPTVNYCVNIFNLLNLHCAH